MALDQLVPQDGEAFGAVGAEDYHGEVGDPRQPVVGFFCPTEIPDYDGCEDERGDAEVDEPDRVYHYAERSIRRTPGGWRCFGSLNVRTFPSLTTTRNRPFLVFSTRSFSSFSPFRWVMRALTFPGLPLSIPVPFLSVPERSATLRRTASSKPRRLMGGDRKSVV